MKKIFILILGIVLGLLSICEIYSSEVSGKKSVEDFIYEIGFIKGNGIDDSEYFSSKPVKLQALVMFVRLKGFESEALQFIGEDNFKDSNQVIWEGGRRIMARYYMSLGTLHIAPSKFEPFKRMDANEYYKWMLDVLGYRRDVDYKEDKVLEFTKSMNMHRGSQGEFTISKLSVATIETLKAKVKGKNLSLHEILEDENIITEEVSNKN